MVAAAQLSQFPGVTTRIVERRGGRLEIGQADGIQARSVETFQAFGFAERIIAEAYRHHRDGVLEAGPRRTRAHRAAPPAPSTTRPASASSRTCIVNQARVLDYFAEFMANAPTPHDARLRLRVPRPEVADEGDYPVAVTLVAHGRRPASGQERTVRAKYVVGADGARSAVRDSIGCTLAGDQANHAWGVMDVLAVTDFPDIRTQVRDPVPRRRQHPAHPARGRLPVPHVRRPR